MWSTFLLRPDANKHGVSPMHTVHFQFSQGKMFLIWLPLRWWGFVQCMDTWPQEQFHGEQKIPPGEAPRIPEGWNQIPVSFTVFPVRSVLNHHCTAFTLDKSYSPRRRFRSEGVSPFLPWGQNRSHPNKHGEVSFQVSARNDSSATKNMNVSTTLSR